MDIMTPIIVVVISLLFTGIGYLIRRNIEKKESILNEVTKERRAIYQQFIDLIIDAFTIVKTGKPSTEPDLINKLHNFYKKYILYASPKVIKSFSDFFQYQYSLDEQNKPDTKIQLAKLTKIMIDMREDLGLSNKKLDENGEELLRGIINDFDKIMKIGK